MRNCIVKERKTGNSILHTVIEEQESLVHQ